MYSWQTTHDAWANGMRRRSTKEQKENLQISRTSNTRVRKLKKELSKNSKDPDESERLLGEIRGLNRRVGSIVNGVPESLFKRLDERRLFHETRRFSSLASTMDIKDHHIFQAGRNVWTCFALQVVYASKPAECSPSVFGYSMLYPYTDNFLDDPNISLKEKLSFQKAFEKRLLGISKEDDIPTFKAGRNAFKMVQHIEEQWDRKHFPDLYLSLVAINDAQTWSLSQHSDESKQQTRNYRELLEQTMLKGGTSVLADSYIVYGSVPVNVGAFAFALGVALQFTDDLQDTIEDQEKGQHTLFTVAQVNKDKECAEKNARRLTNFLQNICQKVIGREDVDDDLLQLVLKITWNIVMKSISRNPQLYRESFVRDWGPLGPLPAKHMPRLQTLKTLHSLAINKMI